jgi:putative hemolysin
MDSSMIYLELAIVAALVIFNGFLAMAELAVVSSRPARLRAMVGREVVGSRRALALASDPSKFLSTVQIGITLIGVLSGAISGATLGLRVAEWLAGFGVPFSAAEAIGVGCIVAVITYISVIVGELVPKQIALRDPESIAVRVAPAMTILARIASPLVWLLDASGRMVLRTLGYRSQAKERVSDEEIRTLIAEAETAGIIEPEERVMIGGVMRLADRPIRAIMTPRRDVDMIDLTDDPESIRRQMEQSPYSRLPVNEGKADEVLGVVQAKELLDTYLSGRIPDIRAHVRSAPIIPDSTDALDAVELIKESPVHMALIHDEYGNFEGIVTTADILESIVGAFKAEERPVEPDAVQRDDGSWLISGGMPADEMAERLGISIPEERPYHTAAGFALNHLENFPQIGEKFEAQDWCFEIIDLDGRRIDKILAARMTNRRRHARLRLHLFA